MTTKVTLELHEHDVEVTTKHGPGHSIREIIKREVKVREFHIYKGVEIEFKELS